ncbi:MAG: hypothetical protein R6U57_06625 [Anaerolineales bacterium]
MTEKITENYEVSQHELMKWYREGRSFQDILKALQTSQLTKIPPEELLSRNMSQSWQEIWREVGVLPT